MPISTPLSPPNMGANSPTPPFTSVNSFTDGPLVGSGLAILGSESGIPPLPLPPQAGNESGQLVSFENPLQLSENVPDRFMSMGFAMESMSRFVQGPLRNFMVGTAQQLGRHSNSIQQNTCDISQLQKQQAQFEKALVKFGNLNKQTFKTAARPEAQTELLAHLIHNGIQTKAGFVSLIYYEPEEVERPQVVVSVVAVTQLFKRVGHGPNTLGKTRDALIEVGFGDCGCLTEDDFDSLFSLFCLCEPQSPSTKQKRLMMMDSKSFFGLLVNIPNVERKKVGYINTTQFKKHTYADDEESDPDINTPFWKEIFQTWSVQLETFVNRAKTAMGQQIDAPLDMGDKPCHIHGIKPLGTDIQVYSCVVTTKAREQNSRRKKRGRRR